MSQLARSRFLLPPLLGILIAGCGGEPANKSADETTEAVDPRGRWWNDRVIDVHGHLGEFEGFDLSLDTLLANIESHGVRLVLVSNIDGANLAETANADEETTNRRALEIVRDHPERLRAVAWTRPTDGAVDNVAPFFEERLEDVDGEDGTRAFVALKLHPEMSQFPADDPAVDPYFELAAELDVPVVYHSGKPETNSDPAKILAAARRYPGVPVVLYHMGFKGPHGPAIEAVAQALEAGDADLYLGTAQADPEAVLRAVRRLGAERVLFGTDAVYYGAEHYATYEPMVELLRESLEAEDFSLVMGDNARRLFGL